VGFGSSIHSENGMPSINEDLKSMTGYLWGIRGQDNALLFTKNQPPPNPKAVSAICLRHARITRELHR